MRLSLTDPHAFELSVEETSVDGPMIDDVQRAKDEVQQAIKTFRAMVYEHSDKDERIRFVQDRIRESFQLARPSDKALTDFEGEIELHRKNLTKLYPGKHSGKSLRKWVDTELERYRPKPDMQYIPGFVFSEHDRPRSSCDDICCMALLHDRFGGTMVKPLCPKWTPEETQADWWWNVRMSSLPAHPTQAGAADSDQATIKWFADAAIALPGLLADCKLAIERQFPTMPSGGGGNEAKRARGRPRKNKRDERIKDVWIANGKPRAAKLQVLWNLANPNETIASRDTVQHLITKWEGESVSAKNQKR